MFSPLSHHTIRFKRYSGRLLVLTSIVLHAFTVYFFTRQPDRFAAFTVLPLWFWGLLGLTIAGTALILLRSPFSMIVCTIWIVTVLFGADEAKVVANIGKKPATKTPLATVDGRPVIRVLTLNCENLNKGSPIEDILAWNPDIILVQEIYPYFVKTICDRAFAGTGHYRVHKSSGIISRWPISRDGRIDQFRDHQVTVSLPDGSNLEVVNVHLASAAPGTLQTVLHVRVVNVKAQADDVHCAPGKRHRDFGAAQVAHAQCFGRARRARLAANFVMVGQRPQLDTIGMCSGGQGFGRERAI